MSMDRKFSDEVIGLGAVYVRVPSSDELVEKLKGDKEFLEAVRGDLVKKVEELEERVKALEPEPSKEIQDLSRWTGVPATELMRKSPEELEKIAPFVLEVEATGKPIELKIEPTDLDGYVPQGEGVATLNGKPINEVEAVAGDMLELVIPAGFHSVKDIFKGFKAKRLVLMSRAMLEYVKRSHFDDTLNIIYNTITDVCSSTFRYASSDWIYNFTFSNCSNLTAIPEGLFSGVQGSAGSMFYYTFSNCSSLTAIPEGLFSGVQGNADHLFFNTFYGCSSLKAIPEGLFSGVQGSAGSMFYYTFSNCSSLTAIPEGLFSGVQGGAEMMFLGTFSSCSSLTAIPEGLFSGVQGNANSLFHSTFAYCTSLKGETPRIDGKKLWMIYDGWYVGRDCFLDCIGLSDYNEIPDDWK